MAGKRLSTFSRRIEVTGRSGDGDPVVQSITYDSRRAGPGSLFVALDGLHTDGHRFIDDALARGAVAVVGSRLPSTPRKGIAYLQVEEVRLALSRLSADFYDDPSASLAVIGVTGTDGKSTTVYLVHQLLSLLGLSSGFLSTVQIMTGATADKNHFRQSTPEASEVQAILADMVANGKEVAVIEATSHGLSHRTNRLRDVHFTAGVLTNITHEHLEFHGTFENYRSDKANLFRALSGEGSFGVVNAADPASDYFRRAAGVPVFSYSTSGPADLAAVDIRPDAEGTSFTLSAGPQRLPARIELPGLFNLDDALAALLTVWKQTGVALERAAGLLPRLEPTTGRMHRVLMGQPFDLVVDYAHTPGAFERLFPAMREQCRGRLIALFGSAGERDVEKRRLQGEIADEWCDLIILADEDPRGEEPRAILEEIASGMHKRVPDETLLIIPERLEAIRQACRIARSGDLVLLLGKGHEGSIIYSDGAREWDEIEAAERCLSELGYRSRTERSPNARSE